MYQDMDYRAINTQQTTSLRACLEINKTEMTAQVSIYDSAQ